MCAQNASMHIRTFSEETAKIICKILLGPQTTQPDHNNIRQLRYQQALQLHKIKADNYTNRSQLQRTYE
jgi:hypothetical protein